MMPRPRKPTEVLEVQGAFKVHPERKREVGPKSTKPLGMPPDYLTLAEVDVWHEVVGNAPGGVLTSTDRPIIEMLVRIMAKSRVEWPKTSEWAVMLQCLVRLGWTPSDRSKVQAVEEKKPDDEFSEFLN